MQIIEKKVYEEGYNNRDRDRTRDRASAGLALGIVGTVLGGAALWSRNRGGLLGGLLGGGSDASGSVPANVNINTSNAGGAGVSYPTPFQTFEKECTDILALTNEMWGLKVGTMQAATQAREVDVAEKFNLYKEGATADFNLYKYNRDSIDAERNRVNAAFFELYKSTRDKDDAIFQELSNLKARVAVNEAVRPYQDALLKCEISDAFKGSINYTDRKTCNVIYGQPVLVSEPTVTGIVGANQCGCPRVITTTAAAAGEGA